jgi:asparagine synthase (glutamine-hydrolysing)
LRPAPTFRASFREMCGIAGIWGAAANDEARLDAMRRAQALRGPDDHGLWRGAPLASGENAPRVGFAHGRLSIIDTSSAGHQPMIRAGHRGDLVLCFNGEIYNFAELRDELRAEGEAFATRTDTEVILAACDAWGVEAAVRRLDGDFAFALWDDAAKTLWLVRDHLGVKPLYWTNGPRGFAFGSEIKAVLASGLPARDVDADALRSAMMALWIPAPSTIFRDVRALPPGSLMRLRAGADGLPRAEDVAPIEYWNPIAAARRLRWTDGAPAATLDAAADELEALLLRAVKGRLISDVPLGAFLSGGLDSSLLVAMMKKLSGEPPKTFTIRFAEEDQRFERMPPDADYAAKLAALLGCDATEIALRPNVAELLPRVVRALDQPIGDPAAINTLLICEAAKPKATVLLSGQGADELFGGYRKHLATLLGAEYQRWTPLALRRGFIEPIARRLPVAGRKRGYKLARWAKRFLANASAPTFERYLGNFAYATPGDLRDLLLPDWADPAPTFAETAFGRRHAEEWGRAEAAGLDSPLAAMRATDASLFLPDLNLQYGDKASMAASVETRVPFCDPAIAAWALALPDAHCVRRVGARFEQKAVLKRVAERWLPREFVHRPKAPFGAPLRSWTRGPLAEMIGDLLSPESLRRGGFLNADAVAKVVAENQSGRADHAHRVWQLLTFETWRREFLDGQA